MRIARTMRASSLLGQGRSINEPRPVLAHCRRQRGIRGAFSLVIFLLCEQEKVTRAPDARGKRTDATTKIKGQSKTAKLWLPKAPRSQTAQRDAETHIRATNQGRTEKQLHKF
ncbi:hypothetical protein [Rudaea cellulosilytica]|uniref:hypothetical protein n=1 Tax=Rudaea cellulosilytica TaxID=540746 RepID=UPI0012F80CE0|nr:hypothetical protein [Rudaea cellulosilytica]